MPNSIKLLCNHLLDDGIHIPEGMLITKDQIQQIIEEEELKPAPKFKKCHVDVKGPLRQNVWLAYQLFSHHTASMLKLRFPEAEQIF